MDLLNELNLISINTQIDTQHTPKKITNISKITSLTNKEEEKLKEFLELELPLFEKCTGRTNLVEHEIRLKNKQPLKQRYYVRNPAMQEIMRNEVDQMLRDDVIEPSSSPWSSPVVLIKKPSGKYRFCIDFRRVNDASIKDAYPLPYISGVLNQLKEANYISTIDLQNGYWQVPLHPDSRPITAFTVPGVGLYQFKTMPFGLHSAPATFQRLLDRIIGPDLELKAFAYLDDIIVLGKTFEEHLALLKEVFKRLRNAGLILNAEKCQFVRKELCYLGHVVNQNGIQTDPKKVESMLNFPTPHNTKGVRSFLGLMSWYRRFIQDFAKISAPLTSLLKKTSRWEWNADHQQAFNTLKERVKDAPTLACPDFNSEFTLQVDASDFGLGAALTQLQKGKKVAIAFASRLLSEQEKRFSTTEKECLALVWGIKTFRPYLEGYHFKAVTDHQALKWLLSIKEPSGRLGRWVLEIQQYDFEICYKKGVLNKLADTLSRYPTTTNDETLEHINTVEVDTANSNEDHRNKDISDQWYTKTYKKAQKGLTPNFKVKDGKLYKKIFPRKKQFDPATLWKLCITQEQKAQVLKENHDEPTAGHLGVRKTIARIGLRYYWPGWKTEVWNYVRKCENCQVQKPEQKSPMGFMNFRAAEGPWYTVVADIMGPFPRSTKGNRFVLVMQDSFTKWIEVQPVRNATAKDIKDKFQEAILYRYGAPSTILTDNGTQFTSQIFSQLTKEWNINHRFTAPYSPQSNPTERSNRVLKTMIRQFVAGNHKHWDRHLSEFRLAMNSASHDSTGYSPAFLNFGRELRLPLTLHQDVFEHPTEQEPITERLHRFRDTYKIVKSNLSKAHQNQAKYYNLRRRPTTIEEGQQVLCRCHELSDASKSFTAKLAPKFEGPYTVIKKSGENIFHLQSDSGQIRRAHIKDLKPFLT